MPSVKIVADLFSAGVKVYSKGDVVELDAAEAEKAVRREWGVIVEADLAATAETAETAPKGKKGRG